MGEDIIEGIIVFDSSGISIYEKLRGHTIAATSLIAALLGLATEMHLGEARTMDFRNAHVYIISGIKNPSLKIAMFSEKPDARHAIEAAYLINKIDKVARIKSGFIDSRTKDKIVSVVDKYYSLLKSLEVSDFINEAFLDSLKEFGMGSFSVIMINVLKLINFSVTEFLINQPIETRNKMCSIFGEFGTKQLLRKMIQKIEEKYNIKIPEKMVNKLLKCNDEILCKEIIRDLIEIIIDSIIERVKMA